MYDAMLKKNPFMSLWLSAANSAGGAARGFWMSELHHQQIALMRDMTEQMLRFWSGAWMISPSADAMPGQAPRRRRTAGGSHGAER